MQNLENLSRIKQQIILLDDEQKKYLAEFLADELQKTQKIQHLSTLSDQERTQQLEWLKANRERFAGKYVALDGICPVGEGKTFREARENALKNGSVDPFVTFVYSEQDIPFGGW